MRKVIKIFSLLSIFSLFTGALFAEETQAKVSKNSIYINGGQMFGKHGLTLEDEGISVDIADMKYSTNFALGFSSKINNKFSVGVQFLIPAMKDYTEDYFEQNDFYTSKDNSTVSNTTVASFLTVDYNIFTINRFTTSVNAALGLAIHYFSYDYSYSEVSSRGSSSGSISSSSLSSTLAYQVGVTEAVKLTNNIDLTLGLAYVNLGSPSLNMGEEYGNATLKLKDKGYVNTTVGLKFNF